MKTITLTKGILLVAVLGTALVFTSCKKNKGIANPIKDAKEINIPCKNEGRSDKNYFRADNSATSQDMSLSREKALTAAKQKIAGLINTKIKSVTDRYVNETEVGTNSDFEQKFENLTREVVNQTLVDIAIVCEKNFQEATGKYTTYVAIEVSKETMLNGINNKLSKDDKLRVDYDKMKFEQIFNEEMGKLEEESGN
jgi:hypothetical protein